MFQFFLRASKIQSFVNEIGKEKFTKLFELIELIDSQINELENQDHMVTTEDTIPMNSNDNTDFFGIYNSSYYF